MADPEVAMPTSRIGRPSREQGHPSQIPAEFRLALLCNASQRLSGTLDAAALTQALLDLVVPDVGDGALVHLLGPWSGADRRELEPTRRSSEALSEYSAATWDWLENTTRSSVSQAMRETTAVLGTTGGGRTSLSQGLDRLTYLVAPLCASGRTVGALTVFRAGGHQRYGQEDLALAEALGNVAGLALENAKHSEARRNERRRIARDLHDHAEQTFFAIGLAATAALNDPDVPSGPRVAELLTRVVSLSDVGAEQLRTAIFALNDTDAANVGLIPALLKLVKSFKQRTGIEADLVLTGSRRKVPSDITDVLHATAREALNNVERHARAHAVVLGLHVTARSISLTVCDDGHGAPGLILRSIAASATHFGLRGIRDRVRQLRGTFASGPGPDGGFLVRARIPMVDGGTV